MVIINTQEELNDLNIDSIQNTYSLELCDVKYIPEGKFHGLEKLEFLNIGNAKVIGSGAFMNCENLKNVKINKDVNEIQDFAFFNTQIGFIPELYENTKFGVYNNIGENITLESVSWEDISKLSKLNICQNYFNVGDEKKVFIRKEDNNLNYETYITQVYGFNHDNLSNNCGKAGITFGFKNILRNFNVMNSESTNVGGWGSSNIRKYLNNDFLRLLSISLQNEIKSVNKICDIGNYDTSSLVTTSDKIFLPSLAEVGLSHIYNVSNQGEKYDIFSDAHSRIKLYIDQEPEYWWLRSSYTYNDEIFFCIHGSGGYDYYYADCANGISPCFCI